MITNDIFLERCKNIHNNNYEYLTEYKGSKDKIDILCKKHGVFSQRADIHLKGSKCPRCVKESNILTNDIFVKKANEIHKNKYLYLDKYINSKHKISIVCKKHGVFSQTPNNHLSGTGCNKCSKLDKGMSSLEFIKKSNIIHKNKYSYKIHTNNIKSKEYFDIMCEQHGEFSQRVDSHLKGHGCNKCSGTNKKDNSIFIEESNYKHNYVYDYSKVEYINIRKKVIIICKLHGEFNQSPNKHLIGRGCPKCGLKFGLMENAWLDKLNIKERQVKIDKYIVDGYEPETKNVYEFNGDFWHGNPNKYNPNDINYVNNISFGELYKKTLERERNLKILGYNVISIWESDFLSSI